MLEGMHFIVNIFIVSFTFDYYYHISNKKIIWSIFRYGYSQETIMIGC